MTFYFNESLTVSSPINIALIKYWGKKDEKNVIPLNNSISLTLDRSKLCSTTFVRISSGISNNKVIVNKKDCPFTSRMQSMFTYALSKSIINETSYDKLRLEIISSNNFPTAAGLASSASGMAALAYGIGKILHLDDTDISVMARLGSGSATRSIFGGIVEWSTDEEGESLAKQLYNEMYWPELKVLICVVNGTAKKTTSTAGMQNSVQSSQLLRYRVEHSVKENLTDLRSALATKDFGKLAAVTMRDSNQLHAVCLDTVPPIVYLNGNSFLIIDFVHTVNNVFGRNLLAYTFDAGPNAFLLFEDETEALVYGLLDFAFGTGLSEGLSKQYNGDCENLNIAFQYLQKSFGIIEFVIPTTIGPGPSIE